MADTSSGNRDSLIYPASSPDAPGDAEVRSEGELTRHEGGRPKRKNE
jgi:hypothetical protein